MAGKRVKAFIATRSNPGFITNLAFDSMKRFVQTVRKANTGKQVVMFPFGGGSGYSYMSLIAELPRDVEVLVINPPGHMMSGGEALESIAAMVHFYTKELRPLLKEHSLFFGHSLGGLVAYEAAKELKDTHRVKGMVISSLNPPHCSIETLDMSSDMDTELLIQKSERMGGVPQIFEEEPELLRDFISGLQGDLKALENYRAGKSAEPKKLDIRAIVLFSRQDYIVDVEKLKEWELYLHCREFISFFPPHFLLSMLHFRWCRTLRFSVRPTMCGLVSSVCFRFQFSGLSWQTFFPSSRHPGYSVLLQPAAVLAHWLARACRLYWLVCWVNRILC